MAFSSSKQKSVAGMFDVHPGLLFLTCFRVGLLLAFQPSVQAVKRILEHLLGRGVVSAGREIVLEALVGVEAGLNHPKC